MHKLPIEKSKGPWKKGKKISLPKSTTRIISLEEKIAKNPLKYVNKFNIESIKKDLIDELDHPIVREYFPGIVKPEAKFDPSSGETKEDLEFQAQVDEIENSTKETLVKTWIELNEKEDPEKLKEEFYEIAYNIVSFEEKKHPIKIKTKYGNTVEGILQQDGSVWDPKNNNLIHRSNYTIIN